MTRGQRTHKVKEGGVGSGSSRGRGGVEGELSKLLALLLRTTPLLGGEAGHLAKVREIVGLFCPALAAWSMVHILGDDGLAHMAAVIHPDKKLEHAAAELERRRPGSAVIGAVARSAGPRLMPEPEIMRAFPGDER